MLNKVMVKGRKMEVNNHYVAKTRMRRTQFYDDLLSIDLVACFNLVQSRRTPTSERSVGINSKLVDTLFVTKNRNIRQKHPSFGNVFLHQVIINLLFNLLVI